MMHFQKQLALRVIEHHDLDIGAHHGPYPCPLRVAPEFVGCAASTAKTFAQPLHGDAETDLVAVSEAVDDRSGRIRDRNLGALDAVTRDAPRSRKVL